MYALLPGLSRQAWPDHFTEPLHLADDASPVAFKSDGLPDQYTF